VLSDQRDLSRAREYRPRAPEGDAECEAMAFLAFFCAIPAVYFQYKGFAWCALLAAVRQFCLMKQCDAETSRLRLSAGAAVVGLMAAYVLNLAPGPFGM